MSIEPKTRKPSKPRTVSEPDPVPTPKLKKTRKPRTVSEPATTTQETPPQPLGGGIFRADSMPTSKPVWFWKERIQGGSVNLLEGRKGMGKSSISTAIAIAICNQRPPGERKEWQPVHTCLWCGSEESSEMSIVPRWVSQGGNTTQLFVTSRWSKGDKLGLPNNTEQLLEFVRRQNVRVIVVDPFTALASGVISSRDEQFVRPYLESLAYVCDQSGACAIIINHLGKRVDATNLYAGMGSSAVVNVARVVLRLAQHPEEKEKGLLCTMASNNGGASVPLVYELRSTGADFPLVAFGEAADYTLEEAMGGLEDLGEHDAMKDARTLLLNLLKDGMVSTKEIYTEAEKAGVSQRTLRRCKTVEGVKSHRVSLNGSGEGTWYWHLPDYDPEHPDIKKLP